MSMIFPIWLSCLVMGQNPSQNQPVARPADAAVVATLENAVANSIETAERSVVAISRIRRQEGSITNAVKGKVAPVTADFRPMAGMPAGIGMIEPLGRNFQSFDYGAGVVIGNQGEMLTAFHVVQGADAILVRAERNQEFMAEVIAADPRSDLAVLMPKEATPQSGLKPPVLRPIKIGNAEKARKGSFLVALGNPFNSAKDGQPSAAFGILSNRARRLDLSVEDGTSGRQLRHLPTLLQLDSKLNLGMSGGAVVNMDGELIGLTTSGGNPQGYDAQAGYAIPMDTLTRRVLASLIKGEAAEYGFLGVSLSTAGDNIINGVSPNTPAARAGLLPQDEIVSINGTPISDGDTLVLVVNSYPVETDLEIKIRRDNREMVKQVKIAKFPVTGEVIASSKPLPWRGLSIDYSSVGLAGAALNPDVPALRGDLVARDGVIVTEVQPDSPAFGKIKVGEMIYAVDDKTVKNPREFREVVKSLTGPARLRTADGDIEIPAVK